MFIARWQIDARFGHKQTIIDMLRHWEREIGPKTGADKMDSKILTGSIGALEATVEVNSTVENLAQLERFFEALGQNDAHKQWGKELEPYVVSGSSKWSILGIPFIAPLSGSRWNPVA